MYKPLPLESLALNQPVPVNIWDPKGVLLLRKGEPITSEQHRGHLMLHSPMVLAADWQAVSYSYTAALDRMVRGNESLSRIAGLDAMVPVQARPEARDDLAATEAWPDMHAALTTLLHQGAEASQFMERLDRLDARTEKLWREHPDDSLLVLVQLLFDPRMHYSTTHALLTAGLCALVGPSAGMVEADRLMLSRAALTMNIGMTRAHDDMARQVGPLSEAQRKTVREHPQRSADVLRQLGVVDAVWLQLVEEHHERPDGQGYPAGKAACGAHQHLLQMADVYVACISPRKSRGGLLSQQVARELYLGPDLTPDPLGALFIKSIGFYPPGSYVRLASGELAVVARRGAKANAPAVFAIVGRQGLLLGEAALRDTTDPAFEVKASLAPGDVKVVVSVAKLLARL
ncbi:HD-GYP domain-containing protein [Hydrogenophaga sp.]|uniref:HD-GYP domain-containing protein n=1 Tax=Hydrogenophaga sp. TaxID=1904254 RepID=UPI00272FC081|nr:HD domain-containing phosphohydrolase [Hydrogenophaga sp.]MDP2017232.1 HD domain-containing phosphohydrolase [Hydrogenophaga sp.]MDP3165541.1 HD domain-containing phosphohydrolase [Hydrogenophaga sp.]MDP3813422.1 HD domain-containing phosphohydrolase [Hydrogenophaga sp.]